MGWDIESIEKLLPSGIEVGSFLTSTKGVIGWIQEWDHENLSVSTTTMDLETLYGSTLVCPFLKDPVIPSTTPFPVSSSLVCCHHTIYIPFYYAF